MPTAELIPSVSGPLRIGDTVSFALVTSSDAPEFLAFISDVTYNADDLRYLGADLNPIYDGAFTLNIDPPVDPSGVTVLSDFQAGTFPAVLDGAETVVTLNFQALTAGPATVTLAPTSRGPIFLTGGTAGFGDTALAADVIVNTAPVAGTDSATVDQGAAVSINVLDNDSDPDGDPLTIQSFTDGANGTVAQASGQLVYTANSSFTGIDSFTYVLSDGIETVTGTVNVTVEGVESTLAPVADTATVAEDGSVEIDVLANDAGENLSVTGVTQGTNGTVTLTTGGLTYTPDPNYNGPDSFTYTVGDGTSTQAVGVSVEVTPVNDAPVANDDSATVAAGESVEIDVLANDTDVDGTVPTIASIGAAGHGMVIPTAGGLTYTPNAGFSGSDSFDYTITDGELTDTATVSVTVDPVFVPSGEVALVPSATGFVRPGETISFALTTSADFPDYTGLESAITYDADLLSLTGVTFNAAFTAGSTTFIRTASEPEGATGIVTVEDFTAALFGTTLAGGTIAATYTFEVLAAGDVDVTVSEWKNGLLFGGLTILTSSPVEASVAINSLAVAGTDAVSVDEDGSVVVDVLVNDSDADGDMLTVQSVGVASNGTASLVDGVVSYTPDTGFSGTDQFTYALFDGKETVTGTVDVTVIAANMAPVAVNDSISVDEDGSVAVQVLLNDTDVDGDTLSVTAFGAAENGTVTQDGDTLTYTPDADFFGSDSFIYTVSDGNGGFDEGTVTVTVNAVNDAPVLDLADSFTFVEGAETPVFTPSATDVDNEPADLSYSLSGADAALFAMDTTTGEVSFKAAPTFSDTGDNVFEIVVGVSDGELTDSQAVSITLLKDSDGDLIPDNADNAIFVFNPLQRDSDSDGYGNVIDADLNNDGFIGVLDVAIFLEFFGKGYTSESDPAAAADFSDEGDGVIDVRDLAAFAALFKGDLGASFIDFV